MSAHTPLPEGVPPLDSSNSWIATSPSGQVWETFSAYNAGLFARKGWTVRTALDHLNRLNAADRGDSHG